MVNSQLAWAAGLLEGEGSFTLGAIGNGTNRLRQLRITCCSIDRDVLVHLQSVLGGNIGPNPRLDKRRPNPKPLYLWCLSKRAEVEPTLITLQPLMAQRRASQIQVLLDYATNHKPIYKLERKNHNV